MELVTKKSDCKGPVRNELVKSPKEAIKKTLQNSLEKEGLVVKLFPSSFVSKNGKYNTNLWG